MYTEMQAHQMTPSSEGGEFGSAEQWVCHHVRRWILEGALTANEEINQQEVATRLGVSRSPVRDALRRLEGMGLVTINPNQRAVVTSFTLDNMREIFEMRAALEGLAAYHAAPRLTQSDLIELESLAAVMARLPDLESYLHKHESFHDLVAVRSGMPRLRRDLARLREMAMPYIRIYGSGRDSAELIGESHDALVRALSLHHAEKASAAFASHARAAYDQLAAEVLRLTEREPRDAGKASAVPPAKRKAGGSATTATKTDTQRGAGRRSASSGKRKNKAARARRSPGRSQ
jgi:DNA-binding GntR family transcriptional regulator